MPVPGTRIRTEAKRNESSLSSCVPDTKSTKFRCCAEPPPLVGVTERQHFVSMYLSPSAAWRLEAGLFSHARDIESLER